MGQSVSVAFCPGNRAKRNADDADAEAGPDGYDLESQKTAGPSSSGAATSSTAHSAASSAPAAVSSPTAATTPLTVISASGGPAVGECNCAELPAGHAHAGASTAAAGASVALSPHIGTDISAPFQPLLYTAAVGPLKCNMVILGDPETKEAVLVDPGGDAEKILGAVKDLGVTITKILITHAHFDHFLAAGEVRKATGAPVCLHPADRVLWDFLPMQLRLLGMVLPRETVAEIGRPDQWLADKQLIGVLDGVCIHTPGHSEGSCCFYWKDSKLLLSGDTLFRGSVGRSDMLGGNADRLKDSILTKLYALPDDVTVITGHGEKTMIGREKRNNAHIRAQL